MRTTLVRKLQDCRRTHSPLTEISDASIRLHLHRVTASVCKVFIIFRLVPPADSEGAAATFDADLRSTYCTLHQPTLPKSTSKQIALSLKMDWLGFHAVTPLIYSLYAASLFDSAKLHVPLSPHTGALLPVRLYTAQSFRRQPAPLRPAPQIPSQ